MRQVKTTVPATTANLGPGFDCLGMALGLYNHITMHEAEGLTITTSGSDTHKIPLDNSNMVVSAAEVVFQKLGRKPKGLHIHLEAHVPVGSGLGSSSTAVLGGILSANALMQGDLTQEDLLQIATDYEGHPDNVAPALLGGLVLGVQTGEHQLHIERFGIPPQKAIIVLPDIKLLTEEARAVLPSHISRQDAIFNSSRIGLLIRALQLVDYNKLAIAMQDRLHQPYRFPLIAGSENAVNSAKQVGAAAVALSGAGPSLIAFAPDHHQAIANAMAEAFQQAGLTSRQWILPIDTRGSEVTIHEI